MYFSKISLRRDATALQQLNQYIHKNGYYYHQLVWQLFSDNNTEKNRDFIYRAEFNKGWPTFYTLSALEPFDMNNLWDVQVKNFQPKIKNGDTLFFMLQANPRVCRKNEAGKTIYCDSIQDAFHKIKEDKQSKADIIQEAGANWLIKKSEKNGFMVKSVIADNFQKHCFKKRKHANPILFSTIDFHGTLEVSDTEKFLSALIKGIGAAKGFGCGMLMVKR